ncbi:MAG: ComF family protein [Pseudomonadales bacterium]|nr:ComF family protein [Pseudomonadales bacterium]
MSLRTVSLRAVSLRKSLDVLVSSRCLLCEGTVRSLKPLCAGCEQDLPWNIQACTRCAIPMAVAAPLCSDCVHTPPLFDGALCAFRYEKPVSGLLNRYKHQSQLACGHWLARSMADWVQQYYARQHWPLPDCVMPVPLHWRRLRQRGFDQGREVACVLSRQLRLPLHAGLRRQRHTSSQQTLSRTQRQSNLADAFCLRGVVQGQTVALVDDVLTTGSTATEITGLLRAAGAAAVHVWAIARTP